MKIVLFVLLLINLSEITRAAASKDMPQGFLLQIQSGAKKSSYSATLENEKMKVLFTSANFTKIFFTKKSDFEFVNSEIQKVPEGTNQSCYRNNLELIINDGRDKKIYRGCVLGSDATSIKLRQIANAMKVGI